MNPSSRLYMVVIACAVVGGVGGLWWRHASPTTLPPGGAQLTSTAKAGLDEILKEPNEIRRFHLMANWVAAKLPAEIARTIVKIEGQNRATLTWLLSAKLSELNPQESSQQIQRRIAGLLESEDNVTLNTAEEESSHSLKAEMLALAQVDAQGALARLSTIHVHPNTRETIICDILAQITESDPQRAVRLLESRTDVNRKAGLEAITGAWAKKDPKEALAWTLSLPASERRDELCDSVIERWAEKDLAAAIEAATTSGFGEDHDYMVKNLLARWLKESPEESAVWLRQQKNPSAVLVEAAVKALSQTHPQLAADLMTQHLPNPKQQNRVSELVIGWMQTDTAGCLAWIRNRPFGSVFFKSAEAAVSSLAEKDPAAAVTFIHSLPRDAYLGSIIAAAASSMASPESALNWLLSLPPGTVQEYPIKNAISRMNFAQPQDALSLLSRMPSGIAQNAVYAAVAERWLSQDRKGAAAWLGTLQNQDVMLAVIKSVGSDWSEADPQGAAAFAKHLGAGPAYEELVPSAARYWSEKDPASAAAWLVSLPDSPSTRQASQTIFEHLAAYQPDEASRLIQLLPAADGRHEAALSWAMRAIAQTNPAAAARLLTTLGSANEQEQWAHRMAYDWSKQSITGAVQWTTSLPEGKIRDSALGGLVATMAPKTPEKALALTSLASSESARTNLISRTISEWHYRDPASALAALDKVNLPEDTKLKLKKQLLAR